MEHSRLTDADYAFIVQMSYFRWNKLETYDNRKLFDDFLKQCNDKGANGGLIEALKDPLTWRVLKNFTDTSVPPQKYPRRRAL